MFDIDDLIEGADHALRSSVDQSLGGQERLAYFASSTALSSLATALILREHREDWILVNGGFER